MEITERMLKGENYREQNVRLKKVMNQHFYLEAVFIEYAIVEDRLASILRYEGNEIKSNSFVSIDRKLNKLEAVARDKKGLAKRYFSEDFINEIREWKNKRNPLIHSMMKTNISSEMLFELACEGLNLQKEICRLSQNYKRAVERKSKGEILK